NTVQRITECVESCQYSQALQLICAGILTAANQFAESNAPWKLVKTDKGKAAIVLTRMATALRIASILLKPFIPRSAEAIYKSFNFPTPWDEVTYADAAELKSQAEDLRVTAELVD